MNERRPGRKSSKKLRLSVTLTFSEPIRNLDQVIENVLQGLIAQRDVGLAPDTEDAITNVIEVHRNEKDTIIIGRWNVGGGGIKMDKIKRRKK